MLLKSYNVCCLQAGNPHSREKAQYLLVLTCLDQLLLIFENIIYKTTYPREEVNFTKPSPSVSISCCKPYQLSPILLSNA